MLILEELIVNGGKRLEGEVFVSGAKNAAVAMIPAAILANDVCVIENLPYIDDVISLADTLNEMGVKCDFLDPHTLRIDSRNLNNFCATYEAVKKIRASYYLLEPFSVGINRQKWPFREDVILEPDR